MLLLIIISGINVPNHRKKTANKSIIHRKNSNFAKKIRLCIYTKEKIGGSSNTTMIRL